MSSRVIEINAPDLKFMMIALRLAKRGLGQAWPNPSVGCVLVHSQNVVGRGWTQSGGRPHAESQALEQLSGKLSPLTAYVTLEPCAHHGDTPPCADALIDSGVTRCVVAEIDPDSRVSGRGIDRMKSAGISVDVGLLREEAREINKGFFRRINKGIPMTTIKLASSLDGCIATRSGDSKWITGAVARARGHLMRAEHDGVLIGAGTAIQDNPRLTCRLPGMLDRSPVRIVLDTHLSLPLNSHLVSSATEWPTWIITGSESDREQASQLESFGVIILRVGVAKDGKLLVNEIMSALAGKGITRLLVEGGREVITTLLNANYVDRINWFRAPLLIGEDGVGVVGAIGAHELKMAQRFRRVTLEQLGEDTLECFVRGR